MKLFTKFIKNHFLFIIFFLFINCLKAQPIKILFDASKAETCGNADWVIDAGTHNLGFNNGPAVAGTGTESNPTKLPLPAQSGITTNTNESFWEGAISYWGIDCVNHGFVVETLPYNGQITYGNSINLQDLSNYKVFIVPEPNIVFTSAEKIAILNFVQNGGGLFMISDHDQSDRNFDGWDSPHIWNDFMSNNTVMNNPFGMTFDLANFSQTSFNIPNLPNDSLLHGPMGTVAEVQWSNGTTLTLDSTQNNSVTGVVYKTGSSFSMNNVMCAHAYYGNGRVAAIGDSSPIDDGSGDPNDQLYDGYIADASGNHRKLLMNTTIWLAATLSATGIQNNAEEQAKIMVYPNPASKELVVYYPDNFNNTFITNVYDFTGKLILTTNKEKQNNAFQQLIDVSKLPEGIYFLTSSSTKESAKITFSVIH